MAPSGLPYEPLETGNDDADPTQVDDASWTFSRITRWKLYGLRINDFLFARVLPAIGSVHPIWPFFLCNGKSVVENRDIGNGNRIVDIKISYKTAPINEYNPRTRVEGETPTFPWQLPAFNYNVSSQDIERTIREIYDFESHQKIWYPRAFTNTAGSPLQANGTRSQSSIRFDYYASVGGFNENFVHDFRGAINLNQVRVAGVNYPELMLRVDNLSAVPQESINMDGTVAYRYWKVSVQLAADPETFWRKWLNVGTMAGFKKNREGFTVNPQPIWTASNTDGRVSFGSRQQMLEISEENAEPISEPMFLDKEGGLSPIDGSGKQEPTYVKGLESMPVDLSIIGMPTEKMA